MRIIVFSDSHGDFYASDRVIKANPEVPLFLHLGDGAREWEDLCSIYPEKKILFVRGNCDWVSDAKTEGIIVCEGKKVFFTHGYTYDVKRDLDKLTQRARSLDADVACFGHTHSPTCVYDNGLYLLGPGSVSLSRNGPPTYGVIDITGAGIFINTCLVERK